MGMFADSPGSSLYCFKEKMKMSMYTKNNEKKNTTGKKWLSNNDIGKD